MKRIAVEVHEDTAHPEGGYAVLVLHGITSLPDGATFRLKPVEARGSADIATGEAWPRGEQRPLAVRQTDSGIELLIGPEIAESPALLPGTLGVIEIQSAGLRGEFLWPSIRPTARPRRRNLSIVKSNTSSRGNPKPISRSAGGNPLTHSVGDNDVLANLNSSRLVRDAGSGAISPSHEAAALSEVPVTALDHAAPATATLSEAIATNVVQLNPTRDAIGRQESAERELSTQSRSDHDPKLLRERGSAELRRRHALAAALACMIVGGAGYMLLRDRAKQPPATAPAEAVLALPTKTDQPIPEQIASVQREAGEQRQEQPGSLPQPRTASPPEAQTAASPGPEIAPSPSVEIATRANLTSAAPLPTPPQEVTLRMRGGGFQISGELKGFDGTKFVIETRSAGTLTMDASRFDCVGDACARPAAAILPLSERPSPAKPDVLRIEGAATLAADFIPQLIRDYATSIGANAVELPREPRQPATRYRISDARGAELATIEVLPGTSATALASLERGAASIALIDRPLTTDADTRLSQTQRAAARQRSPQSLPQQQPHLPSEIVLGLDGIAAVTAPQNPAASLSIENLAKVVSGQISDWFQLGQPPGPIALYLPPDGTGSLETFVRNVLRPRSLEISRDAKRVANEVEAAEAAAKDPRGLALVSFAAQRSARTINLETQCGLIVRPSSFTVKTGEYPLVRRLSLQLAPQLTQPSARGLVRIAQSGEVINAIGAARIVDSSIASLPIEEQSERMAWAANAPASAFDPAELRQMLADFDGAVRLSTTFRFTAGTNELDPASRREVQRLAAALKEPELTGRRIILAGFTDAGGKFQANLSASLRRAGQVRSALLAATGSTLDQRLVTAKGYGPLAPVGCNGTPEGTRLNRRVEVWVAGGKDLRLPQ